MLHRYLPFLCFGVLFQPLVYTQSISGVINHYTRVTDFNACEGWVKVVDTTGFRAGNRVIVAQMQGATINTTNTPDFGSVTATGSAGLFEVAVVDSVALHAVFFSKQLLHAYDTAGSIQLVTYPAFPSATVVDTLFPKAWDGSTGGILAFTVDQTLTLNAPIIADGKGFRGGQVQITTPNFCNWALPIIGYFFGTNDWRGALKGESAAALKPGIEAGRGAAANGGGGANDHNAGGGGGAGRGSGGRGGINDEPAFLNCNGDFPGLGGTAIPPANNRIFPGGGGGSGHSNNTTFSAGTAGGGIIILSAATIDGVMPHISSNGLDAALAIGDGGGGGGGGGSIWLSLQTPNPDLTLEARGGRGGNTQNSNQMRCFGPGGGGGGGAVFCNNLLVADISGGAAGMVTNSASPCVGSTNGGETGAIGALDSLFVLPKSVVPLGPPLIAGIVTDIYGLSVQFTGVTKWASAYWWDFGDNNFSSMSAPLHDYGAGGDYVVKLYAIGPCDTAIQTFLLQLGAPPVAGFNLPDTVLGCITLAQLNVQNTSSENSSTFVWSFPGGIPAVSTLPEPSVTYGAAGTFTVTLIASNLLGNDTFSKTFEVVLLDIPTADFTATVLPNGMVNFENLSTGAFQFTWEFGDSSLSVSTPEPVHQYTQSGTYTVTLNAINGCGVSVLQKTIEVMLPVGASTLPTPTHRVRMYPNPSKGQVWLETPPGNAAVVEVQLWDTKGRLLWQQSGNRERLALPQTALTRGHYWVVVYFETGSIGLPLIIVD